MTNALMKRVCNRKSYRESRELQVRILQCDAERDRWNVTEDGLLSGVDEHSREEVGCRKRPRSARECASAHSIFHISGKHRRREKKHV